MTPPPDATQQAASALPPRTQRRRLPASVRTTQILDAALRVFAARGYAKARIEDIAAEGQLSKGGIYTHFRSKEEIFGALLSRSLRPMRQAMPTLSADTPVTVDVLVRQVIEPMYEAIKDPSVLQTLKLLLADGTLVPHTVERWHEAMIDTPLAVIEQLMRRGVVEGTLRNSVLCQAPRLLMSPGAQMMMDLLVQGEPARAQIARQQAHHTALLHELLDP